MLVLLWNIGWCKVRIASPVGVPAGLSRVMRCVLYSLEYHKQHFFALYLTHMCHSSIAGGVSQCQMMRQSIAITIEAQGVRS